MLLAMLITMMYNKLKLKETGTAGSLPTVIDH